MFEVSTIERVPPHNLEAERCILGTCLLDSNLLGKAMEVLEGPQDFYRQSHQTIFRTMLELYEQGQVLDAVILANRLSDLGKLDETGGMEYLQELLDLAPLAGNVDYYTFIVKVKAIRRNLINAGTVIAGLGYQEDRAVEEDIDKAEEMVFAISRYKMSREDFTPIKKILDKTLDRLSELQSRKSRITGLSTGFRDFDAKTGGLQPANLIVVAARPGLGKTSWCLNLARNVAFEEKKSVAFFSLEMSKEELAERLLCSEAEVNLLEARTGRFPERSWPDLIRAVNVLSELPIYIDDSPSPTVMEIRSKARKLKSLYGIDLMVIDYLQLIRGSGRAENRNQEISDISRRLKALSKELNIPVIAISQLSREVEKRADKRPQLSDLRESGAIEQEADLVIFIYRSDESDELMIAKHRNGPTGNIRVNFLSKCVKFVDLAHGGGFEET